MTTHRPLLAALLLASVHVGAVVVRSSPAAQNDPGTWKGTDKSQPILWGPTDSTNVWEEALAHRHRFSADVVMITAGGMTGLWVLDLLQTAPRQLVIYDLVPQQVQYMKLIINLLRISPSRHAFVDSIFGRRLDLSPDTLTVSGTLSRKLDQVPIDENLIARTKMQLDAENLLAYETMIEPHIIRGRHHRLWPSWPLKPNGQQVDVVELGDMNAARSFDKNRVGSLFFDQAGFMKDESRYQSMLSIIRDTPHISFPTIDLGMLTAHRLHEIGVDLNHKKLLMFTSNIAIFIKGGRAALDRTLQECLTNGGEILHLGVEGHNSFGGRVLGASRITPKAITHFA